jgi:hypothetical protein
MALNLRNPFPYYRFHDYLERLSGIVLWSVLAKVGSAPAMRLTALVPLIGTLLLFNSEIEQLLSWPAFFKQDFALSAEDYIPHHNLYFTYFGLCFLGFGSILFSLFCPREISDEPNVGRYVNDTPSASASTIAKDNFRTVLSLRFSGSETIADNDRYSRIDYPDTLKGEFHELMQLLYENVELEDADGVPEVMNGAGYLDFTSLARMIWNHVRATWPITMPFYDIVPTFAQDVAYLKYRSLDYTRFRIRIAVALTYVVGFALLLKPTLQVFALVAWSIVS